MSGSKTDYVELERQRRALLEQERQERIRRIRVETDKLNNEVTKIKTHMNDINRRICSLINHAKDIEEMSYAVAELNELKNSSQKELTKILDTNIPSVPDAIANLARTMINKFDAILNDCTQNIESFEERITAYRQKTENDRQAAEQSKIYSAKSEVSINIEDADFTMATESISEAEIEISIKEQIKTIFSEITQLVNTDAIQQSDRKKLLAIAGELHKSAFESRALFAATVADYQFTKSNTVRNISIFEETYQEYYAEYIVYLEIINKRRSESIPITPKEKHQFAGIEELQKEMKLLAKAAQTADELSYIRQQIDEVMQNFGYHPSNEIVFFENQKGNHFICEDVTGNSAIHIRISEKNDIMMEIVGTGKIGGTPGNPAITGKIVAASELKDAEKDILLREQGKFCELHPRIIAELKSRGITFSERSRKPASLQYCKKILLASDNFTNLAIHSSLVNKRRKKQTTQIKKQELKAK